MEESPYLPQTKPHFFQNVCSLTTPPSLELVFLRLIFQPKMAELSWNALVLQAVADSGAKYNFYSLPRHPGRGNSGSSTGSIKCYIKIFG